MTINDTNIFSKQPTSTAEVVVGVGKSAPGDDNTLDITSIGGFSDPESQTSVGDSQHENNNNNDVNLNLDLDLDLDGEQTDAHRDENDPLLDFIEEIPLLISDHDAFSDDDLISVQSSMKAQFKQINNNNNQHPNLHRPTALSKEVTATPETSVAASPIHEKEKEFIETIQNQNQNQNQRKQLSAPATAEEIKRSIQNNESVVSKISTDSSTSVTSESSSKVVTKDGLTADQFKQERNQLMSIIIKYIATKINNSFPPEEPKFNDDSNKNKNKQNGANLSLDKFLLLLTSRLKLNLNVFMKGVIYLFRYMDIIYLLRYLNQTNNFVNYNDMGFELKKLIIGCFKLAILREKKLGPGKNTDQFNFNWSIITGLPNHEINQIVKTIMNRMNGKLIIKNIELVRLKSEIFRFVKMVATEV
ncbi:uncharacterized protein RJT21DRAFT_3133 [Scheffersomyces amazonensis]|uniref:uncharacterized protein n=1 Tax=Scheffersomyces amazonensis TaxID=1078765 RepID=UPI00315CD1BB